MITIMPIEGVLAQGDDLRTAAPTKAAASLYTGLKWTTNVVLLTRAPEDIAQWWLKREHMTAWSRVLTYPDNGMTWDHWKIDYVRECLAEGWEVFAFVDTHLHVVDEVKALGVVCIYVAYPRIAPGWKEVAPPRAWADVAATVDQA